MKQLLNAVKSAPAKPSLLRFLALHAAIGALSGLLLAVVLVVTNAAGLGTLLGNANTPFAAWLLYLAMFAFTFASLKMGTAIMLLPYDRRDTE